MPQEFNATDIAEMASTIGSDMFGVDASASTDTSADTSMGTAAETATDVAVPTTATTAATDTDTDTVAAETAATAETPAVAEPKPAPSTWRNDAKAAWDALPPVVQEEVLKREADMFRGIDGYKQAATLGNQVTELIKPYEPLMRQHGIDPIQQLGNLMQAHYTLATGSPEQKAQLFQQLASSYGVTLDDANSAVINPYVDPAVRQLSTTVSTLQQKLQMQEMQAMEQRKSAYMQEIDTFAKDPANKHFDAVAEEISTLLKSGATSLREAYDKAVWLNPVVREKMQAEAFAKQQEMVKRQEEERLQKAKEASAANLTAKRKASTVSGATMDETLNNVYDRLFSK